MAIRHGDKPLEYAANGRPIWAFKVNKDGKRVPCCGSDRSDENLPPCESTVLYMNGRCKKHGGPLVHHRGLAHPSYLRTPERMPKRLQEQMTKALADKDITDLEHELALLDVRIDGLKESLDGGYDPFVWRQVSELATALQHALDTDDDQGSEIAERLIRTIKFGHNEQRIHTEISRASMLRARIAEIQVRNRVALKTMLPGEQALALGTGMVAVVREEAAKLLSKIEADYSIRLDSTYRDAFFVAVAQGLGKVVSTRSRPDGSFYTEPT